MTWNEERPKWETIEASEASVMGERGAVHVLLMRKQDGGRSQGFGFFRESTEIEAESGSVTADSVTHTKMNFGPSWA